MTREQRLQRFAPDLPEACKSALATLLDERLDPQEAIDTLGGVVEAIEGLAHE